MAFKELSFSTKGQLLAVLPPSLREILAKTDIFPRVRDISHFTEEPVVKAGHRVIFELDCGELDSVTYRGEDGIVYAIEPRMDDREKLAKVFGLEIKLSDNINIPREVLCNGVRLQPLAGLPNIGAKNMGLPPGEHWYDNRPTGPYFGVD